MTNPHPIIRYTHRRTGSPEYLSWRAMKMRCTIPNATAYDRYGGSGITICDRWLNSFENFLDDMGPRPSADYSLERIDNLLGYSPENCRWATKKEQANNRRNNRLWTYQGETKTVSAWAKQVGIHKTTLLDRVVDFHWSIEKALTTPVNGYRGPRGPYRRRTRFITYEGATKTVGEWSQAVGIKTNVLWNRIYLLHWSIKKALTP